MTTRERNQKRKSLYRALAIDQQAWRPQKGFEFLADELLKFGKARIMGYAELRLPAERRAELRAAGVFFK